MTEDISTDDQSAEATLPLSVAEWNSFPDGLLVNLVRALNQTEGTEIAITLHVSGLVISGLLVPAGDFFDHLAQWFRDNNSPEMATGLAEFMATQVREEAQGQTPENIPQRFTDPNFMHLREARVFTSSTEMPFPATLWRGRLSEVDGWSMGQLVATVR